MAKRRVVITGMGCVTPVGNDVERFWESLKAGKSGAAVPTAINPDEHKTKVVAEVKDFNPEDYMEAKEAKRADRFMQFAYASAVQAFEDSGLDFEKEDRTKVGVIVGSGAGGFITIEKNHIAMMNRGFSKCSPFTVPMLINNAAAGKISIKYGTRGINKSVVSACATGTHCIGDAARAIEYGEQDIMFAGGAEAIICDMGIGAFVSAHTLSTRECEPEKASCPYDKARDGFVMGEGAGIVILEELEHALKRGAKIYAEVAGYGQSSDAYDTVAPDPNGNGAELAVRNALADAELTPDQIDYVNAHGTSTHLGDIAESQMIARVFGDKDVNKNLLVSSTKSMTGHLLGGAGSIETIACVKAIEEGIVPPTINLNDLDDEVGNLDYVPNTARKHNVKAAVNNSFGFGGCNSVLVLKKFEK